MKGTVIICALLLVLPVVMLAMAETEAVPITRDLDREAAIKAAIIEHKQTKIQMAAIAEETLVNVSLKMIAGANIINDQAAAIRAEVDDYITDSGATKAQAETLLALVDEHLDTVSVNQKARMLVFLKAVHVLAVQILTDEEITDTNLLN